MNAIGGGKVVEPASRHPKAEGSSTLAAGEEKEKIEREKFLFQILGKLF
jgi:hypothetical protein